MTKILEAISDISRKVTTIEKRIEYLKAHPQEVTLGQSWAGKPYAESANLALLEVELIMMRGCGELLMRGVGTTSGRIR